PVDAARCRASGTGGCRPPLAGKQGADAPRSPERGEVMIPDRVSRRDFLVGSGALALGALSYDRVYGANEKLRVAPVGVGGKGWSDLTEVAASPHVLVAALCDVDETKEHLGRAAEKYPAAKRFTDWRKLFERPGTFDAVIVSTPDHMHAPIA